MYRYKWLFLILILLLTVVCDKQNKKEVEPEVMFEITGAWKSLVNPHHPEYPFDTLWLPLEIYGDSFGVTEPDTFISWYVTFRDMQFLTFQIEAFCETLRYRDWQDNIFYFVDDSTGEITDSITDFIWFLESEISMYDNLYCVEGWPYGKYCFVGSVPNEFIIVK